MALTSRGRALRWLTRHRNLVEQPFGSNSDNRRDGIRAAQVRLARGAQYLVGAAWCGTWHANALLAAGVRGVSARQASVALIEDDARARHAPYGHGWVTTSTPRWWRKVRRGDGVVLFGRGVHVGTVRSVAWHWRKLGLIRTSEGNTTSGDAGDQANGGGSYNRLRRLSQVHGFACADFPNR